MAVLNGPADEPASQAAGGRAASEPVLYVGLAACGWGRCVCSKVGQEVESDGGGLLGGEEGALLQLAGLGEVVHAVEVNPTPVLGDQPPIVWVCQRRLAG